MKNINPFEIQKRIKNNQILNKLVYFDSIDSTNKFLSENDFASGTVVLAAKQTAGRGKRGAAWASAAGGLWFSYVINKKIRKPYDYVVLSSVAVVEALKKHGVNAEIKWPNDIIAEGKKLAGILLENDYYSARLITGIGINVNNKTPAGINAVSVKQLTRGRADVNHLAVDIVRNLDHYIAEFRQTRSLVYKKWTDKQKNLEGSVINLIRRGKKQELKVLKVSAGIIMAVDRTGGIKTISGEVFFK
jgi:BirA family biotin operon repressor/biotin-[acetyl-CoA-carboxylase] ligase